VLVFDGETGGLVGEERLDERTTLVGTGRESADDWLIRNSSTYGLCQIYANEIWHFELASDYGGACPPLRPNAAG